MQIKDYCGAKKFWSPRFLHPTHSAWASGRFPHTHENNLSFSSQVQMHQWSLWSTWNFKFLLRKEFSFSPPVLGLCYHSIPLLLGSGRFFYFEAKPLILGSNHWWTNPSRAKKSNQLTLPYSKQLLGRGMDHMRFSKTSGMHWWGQRQQDRRLPRVEQPTCAGSQRKEVWEGVGGLKGDFLYDHDINTEHLQNFLHRNSSYQTS